MIFKATDKIKSLGKGMPTKRKKFLRPSLRYSEFYVSQRKIYPTKEIRHDAGGTVR